MTPAALSYGEMRIVFYQSYLSCVPCRKVQAIMASPLHCKAQIDTLIGRGDCCPVYILEGHGGLTGMNEKVNLVVDEPCRLNWSGDW
eukprot:scaffold2939_cov406-Prasinococcus_capsulatus_cf.AAC.11